LSRCRKSLNPNRPIGRLNSTSPSTSLPGVSSPRAMDPKMARDFTPWFCNSSRLSIRRSIISSLLMGLSFYGRRFWRENTPGMGSHGNFRKIRFIGMLIGTVGAFLNKRPGRDARHYQDPEIMSISSGGRLWPQKHYN
jgi:hypothetical protein